MGNMKDTRIDTMAHSRTFFETVHPTSVAEHTDVLHRSYSMSTIKTEFTHAVFVIVERDD